MVFSFCHFCSFRELYTLQIEASLMSVDQCIDLSLLESVINSLYNTLTIWRIKAYPVDMTCKTHVLGQINSAKYGFQLG